MPDLVQMCMLYTTQLHALDNLTNLGLTMEFSLLEQLMMLGSFLILLAYCGCWLWSSLPTVSGSC